MTNEFKPGDIVLINLNKSNSSILISKKRPAIVVSNLDATRVSPILQIVPLTTQIKQNLPTHVVFKRNNDTKNTALCEQIMTVEKHELEPTDEWVNNAVLKKVKKGLKAVFDIE